MGDITETMLGVEEVMYQQLVDEIEMVVHCAAKISLHGLYNELKVVNVDGTKNMIDFALNTKQKYFIHVSTIAVMGDRRFMICPAYAEKDYDLGQGFKNLGYEQSKFEAEGLVRSAGKDGLKWIIARSGYLMGDSEKGYYPLGLTRVPGIFYDIFKTAIELKIAINSDMHFDITPVDYVSKALVYLSTVLKDIYSTYHLNNPNQKTLNDIIKLLINYGYQVDLVNYDEYINILRSGEKKYRSIYTDLVLLGIENDAPKGFSFVDSSYTKEVLSKANIVCPDVDDKLIKTYLDYCIDKGYLEKPDIKKER